jgi:hypothetical protein
MASGNEGYSYTNFSSICLKGGLFCANDYLLLTLRLFSTGTVIAANILFFYEEQP